MDKKALSIILECLFKTAQKKDFLDNLGKEMFRLFTECGFPPECFLDEIHKRLKLSKEEKVVILFIYQGLFIDHQLKAGMNEKNLKKHQETNKKQIVQLFEKGELY